MGAAGVGGDCYHVLETDKLLAPNETAIMLVVMQNS